MEEEHDGGDSAVRSKEMPNLQECVVDAVQINPVIPGCIDDDIKFDIDALHKLEINSSTKEVQIPRKVRPIRGHEAQPRISIKAHSHPVYSVAFSADGATFATGSDDSSIVVWDARTTVARVTLKAHTNAVYSVAFSHDGTLASASGDGTVIIWDLTAAAPRAILPVQAKSALSVAFSPDGAILASASSNNDVMLWDLAAILSAPTPRAPPPPPRAVLRGHSHWAWCVAFSPDSATLASASLDSTIALWDTAAAAAAAADAPPAPREVLRGHSRWVRSVAFSPDGCTLASASDDRTVILWALSAAGGGGGTAPRAVLRGHTYSVYCVAFSRDGGTLASTSDDKSVILWDPPTGARRATLRAHRDEVNALAFSPDGAALASVADDGVVILWGA